MLYDMEFLEENERRVAAFGTTSVSMGNTESDSMKVIMLVLLEQLWPFMIGPGNWNTTGRHFQVSSLTRTNNSLSKK